MSEEKGLLYNPPYYLPYPSLQVNKYLNNGGIPAGSISQIQSSGEGSFKTSVAIQMLGEAQNQGLSVGYIDAEGALSENSRPWLEGMGLDVSECYIKGPDSGEAIWETIERWVKKEGVKVIVADSIHAIQPEKLHVEDVGHHHIGNHAMLHKQGLIKANNYLQKNDATLIAINHRGVNLTSQGARGKKATGGRSWKFYSEFIFIHWRTNSKSTLGGEHLIPIEIYIKKNKGGESFISIDTYAEQGKGICREAELLQLGMKAGLFTKKRSWYSFNDETIAQGETGAINWIKKNYGKVESLVREAQQEGQED